MAKKYVIEYKVTASPYHYEYLMNERGDFKAFDSIVEARKKGILLISNGRAIVSVVRGIDKEELVYATKSGGFVLEDRRSNSYWYHLNKNGTLGSAISSAKFKNLNIIYSAHQRW